MTSNINSVSVSQPALPIFTKECYDYEHWSIKMRALFKSQDLWDLGENGYSESDDVNRVKENKKRDLKTLFSLSRLDHDSVLSRIAGATTFKQASLVDNPSNQVPRFGKTFCQEFETLYIYIKN